MKRSGGITFASALAMMCGALAVPAFAQTAPPPYSLSVFAKAPSGSSAPDSIAVLGDRVFVGYGDGHKPDGSDGLSSQIVEYTMQGNLVRTLDGLGHNDGLKVDPVTQTLWALQNEDANPNLVIFDPDTGKRTTYRFSATPHGGGYDDIVFRDCKVFISASNPANNPNTGPAIVSARLDGNGTVDVKPVLAGNATATDLLTGASVQLNLQDPDSMTLDNLGDIVLDSQADQELIIVTNPDTADQGVLRLPLSYATASGLAPVETDDTAFVSSSQGFILFADKGANTVYLLTEPAFAPGSVFTAADGGPFVGTLDLTSGVVTPIVTGLSNPGGLVFVDTSGRTPDHTDAKKCQGEGD